ncbi:serine hydrolase [Pseudophaeobacter sp. EL27]|uniref:serine hydrolase domain-containing protein n=1 Tax=Pseudophaeobacter sp. EL27 TaxID=2107580 RepID=UPI0013C4F3BB|nr:serine hydrolase domain-containing protein [Pseudophaeobacter sp. EL27]
MTIAVLNQAGQLLRDDLPTALFPWWSFTKPVLAALVLRAAANGAWDLDAPLHGRPYSLRHLLQHRAGVPEYGGLASYKSAVRAAEPPWSPARLLREVNSDRLDFAPGASWNYSNSGYLILRQKLEHLHGAGLAQIMQAEILTPLGLSARLAQDAEDFALLHWPAAGYHPGWVYHGCLMGTAQDATRLLQALLHGDLLPTEARKAMLLQDMRGGPIPGRVWSEIGYGLGIMIGAAPDAGRIIGHSGCGPISANLVAAFPELPGQPIVAAFVQGGDETPAEFTAVEVAAAVAKEQAGKPL